MGEQSEVLFSPMETKEEDVSVGRFFVGPLFPDSELSLVSKLRRLTDKTIKDNFILIARFVVHPMKSSCIFKRDLDDQRQFRRDSPPYPRRSSPLGSREYRDSNNSIRLHTHRTDPSNEISEPHYFAILWIERAEEEFDVSLCGYLSEMDRGKLMVLKMDRSCVYISRFGAPARKFEDKSIGASICSRLEDQQNYTLVVCTMRKIDLELQKRQNKSRGSRPVDERKESDDHRVQLLSSDVGNRRRARDREPGLSVESRCQEKTDNPELKVLCRFALVWIQNSEREIQAKTLMQRYHNQYVFDSEESSRFEILGYESNIDSSLTHEVKTDVKECCHTFWCRMFWVIVFYPFSCCFVKCVQKRNPENFYNYDTFQQRLVENPARLFWMYRKIWRKVEVPNCLSCCWNKKRHVRQEADGIDFRVSIADQFSQNNDFQHRDPDSCCTWSYLKACCNTTILWVTWTVLLLSALYGVSLYKGRDDGNHPLTFVECFFQLVGYGFFTIFTATWISRRSTGVTGYEHLLLYHNFEVYACDKSSSDESILNDFRGLTALKPAPKRISLLQYMHQYNMLHELKFHKSPFCNVWTAMWPLPDALTNEQTCTGYIKQFLRSLLNLILLLLFGIACKSEMIFFGKKYHALEELIFSGWAMVVSLFWFSVLVWCTATVFVRMIRYLHCIERLSLLLSNKLTSFYVPLNRGTENVLAWHRMRSYIVRTGELVFSSIEVNCLFIALADFIALCSMIWCFFFGHGVNSHFFSNSAFNAWLFLTLFLSLVIVRVLYTGYKFSNAEEKVTRRLLKHRTNFAQHILSQRSYDDTMKKLDLLIQHVKNVSVVPKLFGRRIDGLLFPTLCLSFVSLIPTILTRFYTYKYK